MKFCYVRYLFVCLFIYCKTVADVETTNGSFKLYIKIAKNHKKVLS